VNSLLAAAAASLALYAYSQQQSAADGAGAGILDTVTGYVNDLGTDEMTALQDTNVQAFLMMIRTGEGTANGNGYRTLFGGGLFNGFADHPRISVTKSGYTSTAAGAYQIIVGTWDSLGLPDFSPANQDIAAVRLIKRRGALNDVIAGRLALAIAKCNKEWASLPGSPYGQPTITMAKAEQVFAQWGGSETA